ncbi:MAG: stage V sporulation protein T [Firmicutes bacterium]|nr:stage V sporulation protein T [Bacillota bacterium]
MKATGIVRRIDDLGRVVIPKEIRRTLRIREGDPLEIFVDRDGEVILKKYSPIGELGDFAQEYVESLYDSTGHTCLITDRDLVIAVAGASKKEFLNQPLGSLAEMAMEERRTITVNDTSSGCAIDWLDGTCKLTAQVVSPIVAEGHPLGCVIICSKEPNAQLGEVETKLAETAASFLGKQMEG